MKRFGSNWYAGTAMILVILEIVGFRIDHSYPEAERTLLAAIVFMLAAIRAELRASDTERGETT